jgi:hypothetical protein
LEHSQNAPHVRSKKEWGGLTADFFEGVKKVWQELWASQQQEDWRTGRSSSPATVLGTASAAVFTTAATTVRLQRQLGLLLLAVAKLDRKDEAKYAKVCGTLHRVILQGCL